jgi:hypothetical protein
MTAWGKGLTEADKREQFKLVYDYIKFHMGLYLSTPPLFALFANALSMQASKCFLVGLVVMICIYVFAAVDAALFIGRHVNNQWQDDYLDRFALEAFSPKRRFRHHTLYWIAIGFGLAGLILAFLAKHVEVGCLTYCV